MNLKILSGLALLLTMIGVSLSLITSCRSKDARFPNDSAGDALAYLKEVHEVETSDLETDSLLLYVDYSTCVAEAMNSSFFQEVQPTIVSNHPLYFSIKGDKITREKGDTYQLLRGVKEVNNADLKSAAEQISRQNRQAVLITDAEYWHPSVGDNLNNPYMKEALGEWLKSGRDIYIYAEPYLESGKFNKQRYYIVFTDDRMNPDENINEKMQKGISSLGDVKKIHLSARVPKMTVSADMIKDEDGYTLYKPAETRDNFRAGTPLYVFETGISDIAEALKNAGENKKGEPIDLPFISGINIPADLNGIFKIEDYDVKVYDLTEQAVDFVTPAEDENGDLVVKKATCELTPMDDVFDLEEDSKTGEFALYFDEDFDTGIKGPKLLRVDIVADKAETLFGKDTDVYNTLSWESISKAAAGKRNNSFFESVKQAVINDKTINPAAPGRNVVTTFYIVTE